MHQDRPLVPSEIKIRWSRERDWHYTIPLSLLTTLWGIKLYPTPVYWIHCLIGYITGQQTTKEEIHQWRFPVSEDHRLAKSWSLWTDGKGFGYSFLGSIASIWSFEYRPIYIVIICFIHQREGVLGTYFWVEEEMNIAAIVPNYIARNSAISTTDWRSGIEVYAWHTLFSFPFYEIRENLQAKVYQHSIEYATDWLTNHVHFY